MKNDNVNFRLAPEYLRILDEEARKEGESANLCARRLLIRALSDTERSEVRSELEKIQKDFKKMRGDLATLGKYLLIKVAKENPDDADALVREIFAP